MGTASQYHAGGLRHRPGRRACWHHLAALLLLGCAWRGTAAEPAVTVLADFEDPSVAVSVTEVRNISPADAHASLTSIPARGRGALSVEIGATARNVSATCGLVFRETTRFESAEQIAAFCWITTGAVDVAFRLRDARDQVFETRPQRVQLHNRWVQVTASLAPDKLTRVAGSGGLTMPLEVQGCRFETSELGKQTICLDDLQVQHRVAPRDLILGSFRFDEPTRIYEPGAPIAAKVVFENRSRSQELTIAVNLAWIRSDGTTLHTHSGRVLLPAAGVDYRSYRALDYSQAIAEPGLYRLVAQARGPGWLTPNVFETAVAVTPSNRRLSRGRTTFFSLRSNTLREPPLDQDLETSVACDIGVNLFALEVPWERIEPKPGVFELADVDEVVTAVTRKGMAAMVVLVDPPDWLPSAAASRVEPLQRIIETLAGRMGPRLLQYQLGADVLGVADVADQLTLTMQLADAIGAKRENVTIMPPPIDTQERAAAPAVKKFGDDHPDAPLMFRARGDVDESRAQLEAFRARGGFAWGASHVWLHVAAPLTSAGSDHDAEAVLRFHVAAAAAGVGGVMWYELRDDANNVEHPEELRGLLRRDFSPKTRLLGYAAASGRLTGYRYAGKVANTPPEFASALFIGGNKQVGVFLPQPNRVLPAVLTPVQGVRGVFSAQDFARRPQPLLFSDESPLVVTMPKPFFMVLTTKQPDPDPQLRLVEPWIRVPGTVFCGADTAFTIEVDAWRTLSSSYLQLRLPEGAPVETSFSARGLAAEKGETIAQEVQLTPRDAADFNQLAATLRVSFEGTRVELPLTVRRLIDMQSADAGDVADASFRLGTLQAGENERPTASATVRGQYQFGAVRLAIEVADDRVVPVRVDRDGRLTGDQLLLGIAREGAAHHAEVRIDPADDQPDAQPIHDTEPARLAGWRCQVDARPEDDVRTYRITIPARALEARALRAGDRLLLAVHYSDDDADGFAPIRLTWGGGLRGARDTADFRWIRLK